jgi:endonuclease YncB( thermonuclease family)
MPYLLIEGTFRILGAAPDGDSVRFYPNNVKRWQDLSTLTRDHRVQPNSKGGVQLRLDGIDALETHYQAFAQPLELAHAAAAKLLGLIGFTNVTRGNAERVTAATPEGTKGHILTKFADKYGRAVAFVFAGGAPERDGEIVFVEPERLKNSLNYLLLEGGFAYPTYYKGLYFELRDMLTTAVKEARAAQRGVWEKDQGEKGFTVENLQTITEGVVMLPKLFRRLADYLEGNDGDTSLAGFESFLEAKDDKLTVLSTGQFTGFDNVLQIAGQFVKLLNKPEDLVFFEK